MLNRVFLIGRLTRDPEIRFLPTGTQVTSFVLAVNRHYKTKDSDEWKEETYFFDVETFGALAERLGKQLDKGIQIVVEGQLRQDRWETESGEKRSRIKIVAEKVNVVYRKKEETKTTEDEETEPATVSNTEEEDVPF